MSERIEPSKQGQQQNTISPDLQSLCDHLYEVFNEDDTPDELSHGAAAAIEILWRERDQLRLALQKSQQEVQRLRKTMTSCKVHLTTFNENEVCPQCWISFSSHRTRLQESQQRVKELEAYREYHKTCLELSEECSRDISLERRVNSSLRSKVDQQQAVIQQLAEALRDILNAAKTEDGWSLLADSFYKARVVLQAAALWLKDCK